MRRSGNRNMTDTATRDEAGSAQRFHWLVVPAFLLWLALLVLAMPTQGSAADWQPGETAVAGPGSSAILLRSHELHTAAPRDLAVAVGGSAPELAAVCLLLAAMLVWCAGLQLQRHARIAEARPSLRTRPAAPRAPPLFLAS